MEFKESLSKTAILFPSSRHALPDGKVEQALILLKSCRSVSKFHYLRAPSSCQGDGMVQRKWPLWRQPSQRSALSEKSVQQDHLCPTLELLKPLSHPISGHFGTANTAGKYPKACPGNFPFCSFPSSKLL